MRSARRRLSEKDWRSGLKFHSVLFFSSLSLIMIAYGVYQASRSSLFTIQTVSVEIAGENPDEAYPLKKEQIRQLAGVPVGQINLFELDFNEVASRVKSNPWIRYVDIQKSFPSTLLITVTFREPVAVFQKPSETLAYVDQDGTIFGKVDLMDSEDVPLITSSGLERVRVSDQVLSILRLWNEVEEVKNLKISALDENEDGAVRLLVLYPLLKQDVTGKAVVLWSDQIEEESKYWLARIGDVFRYLIRESVVARQVWLNEGKKIVVRTKYDS